MALPDELKHVLVEDWSKVTGEKMLPVLPAKVTVSDILDRFCKHGGPKGTAVTDTTREVAAGIKVYFQEALGTMLLYKFERPQYDELIKENSDLDPCDTYGGVHLLRLFGLWCGAREAQACNFTCWTLALKWSSLLPSLLATHARQ